MYVGICSFHLVASAFWLTAAFQDDRRLLGEGLRVQGFGGFWGLGV